MWPVDAFEQRLPWIAKTKLAVGREQVVHKARDEHLSARRSERRLYGDVDYRLFDYDQPHVFTAVASYAVAGWSFGARFRFASGAPRTPVVGATYAPAFGLK